MQHGSGKLLQNIGADYIGRNAVDCTKESCAVCDFAKEKGESLLSSLTKLVVGEASVKSENVIDLSKLSVNWTAAVAGLQDIPIGNHQAWAQLQSNDEAITQAISYKKSGQLPPKSGRDMPEIRSYVAHCKVSKSSKLLIKEDPVPYESRIEEKIVVPKWFLLPLLAQIHQDQNCPEPNQLKKVFDRYFHAYQAGDIFKEISENCQTCQARKRIPKEMKHFKSITNPDSPGSNFVSDVLRRSKQFIFTTRDAFSDFVTTAIIQSEKAEDLKEGIIATTSSVRRNSNILVRVDSAPGFKSLKMRKDKDLEKLGITIELSDSKNKNGVAIVDRAIQELEKEITTLSPENKPLCSSDLAKATISLNSRIRNRNLSSYEIMFSREQNTGDNIQLDDKEMASKKLKSKEENHRLSEKSKFPKCKEPVPAEAEKGDYVFLKEDGGKHQLRDIYLVIESSSEKLTLVKMLHSLDKNENTKLSSRKVEVHQNQIYKSNIFNNKKFKSTSEESCEEKSQKVADDKVLKSKRIPKTEKWSPFGKKSSVSSESDTDSDTTDSETYGNSSVGATDEEEDTTNDEEADIDSHSNNGELEEIDIDIFQDAQEEPVAGNNANIDNENTDEVEEVLVENADIQELGADDEEVEVVQELHQELEDNSGSEEHQNEEIDHPPHDESDEELYDITAENPQTTPKQGDLIKFLNKDVNPPSLITAEVTHIYKSVQKKYPGWCNIQREDFLFETSVDLLNTRWKFLRRNLSETSLEDASENEASATPSEAFNNAMEGEVPQDDQLSIPFKKVRNMENVLPLTSTPMVPIPESLQGAAGHSRPRLSGVRPRGLLPNEMDTPEPRPSACPSRIKQAMVRRARQVKAALSRNEESDSN